MPNPLDVVRDIASKYPEAEMAFLFGDHEVYRVRKKVFVWLGTLYGGSIDFKAPLAYFVASSIVVSGAAFCGGFQRRGPTGGAA